MTLRPTAGLPLTAVLAVLLLSACKTPEPIGGPVYRPPPPGPIGGPVFRPPPGPIDEPGYRPPIGQPLPGPGPIDEPGYRPPRPPIGQPLPGPGPIDGPGYRPPRPPREACDVNAVRYAIGESVTDRRVAELRARSGASTVRVLGEDQMVTREYMYGRLNVTADRYGRIVDISCG